MWVELFAIFLDSSIIPTANKVYPVSDISIRQKKLFA